MIQAHEEEKFNEENREQGWNDIDKRIFMKRTCAHVCTTVLVEMYISKSIYNKVVYQYGWATINLH